ncbi:MAG: hypothetical protein F8N39_16950 [Clostridiaceae bacterium]|nr:hypothetical protein [Clostridiaceae bacterium]
MEIDYITGIVTIINYEFGARITLEKEVNRGIPFAITCWIYGLMVHTVYCSDFEKDMKYESLKQYIERLMKELNDDNISELVEEFVNKY